MITWAWKRWLVFGAIGALGGSGLTLLCEYLYLAALRGPALTDERALIVTLDNPGNVVLDTEFQALLERLRNAGVPAEQLAGVVAAEFDRQLAFLDHERKSTRFFYLMAFSPQGWSGERWQHKRDDLIIRFVGAEAFHRWNHPLLLQQLRLDRLRLTPVESNAVYRICQQYQHAWRQADAGDHPEQLSAPAARRYDYKLERRIQAGIERRYRQELRAAFGERRYYLFVWDNRFERHGWQSTQDDILTEEQRIDLGKVDDWRAEQEAALEARILASNPAGVGTNFLINPTTVPSQFPAPTFERNEREAIWKATEARRAAIYAQTNAAPVPPR